VAPKFSVFMRGIEEEARAEGPEAVAQLEALRDHFRLGRQLAQARLEHKLSQPQVAERAKMDPGEVSKIERGMANPTHATLSGVAYAVGLEVGLKRRSLR
jgi:ribosome-binding protein aMBF1 (putative translation factor)